MISNAVVLLFLIAITACLLVIRRYLSTTKALEGRNFKQAQQMAQLQQQVMALSNERDLLREVIDTPHNPIFVIDKELRLLFVNQAMGEAFGLEPIDMLGMSLDSLVPDVNELQKLRLDTDRMLRLGETGGISEFKIFDSRHNDTIFYKLDRQVLHGGGVAIMGTDITTLKQLLDKYIDLDSQYGKLIEHTHNLILQISADWQITYANPACYQILGLTQAECLRKSWLDIIHPGDRQKLKAQFGRWSFMTRRKNEANWEFRVITNSGDVRTLLWGISIYWHDDQFAGIQADGTDITEQKQTEIRVTEAHNEAKKYNQQYQEIITLYEKLIQTNFIQPNA